MTIPIVLKCIKIKNHHVNWMLTIGTISFGSFAVFHIHCQLLYNVQNHHWVQIVLCKPSIIFLTSSLVLRGNVGCKVHLIYATLLQATIKMRGKIDKWWLSHLVVLHKEFSLFLLLMYFNEEQNILCWRTLKNSETIKIIKMWPGAESCLV